MKGNLGFGTLGGTHFLIISGFDISL